MPRLRDARNELLLRMSRARKIKKVDRYFEYELEFFDVHVFYGGPDERHARRSRTRDKTLHGGGWGWLRPAPVKHTGRRRQSTSR